MFIWCLADYSSEKRGQKRNIKPPSNSSPTYDFGHEDISSDEDFALYEVQQSKKVESTKVEDHVEMEVEPESIPDKIEMSEIPEIPDQISEDEHKNLQRKFILLDMRQTLLNKIEANKLIKAQQELVKIGQETQAQALKTQVALEHFFKAQGNSLATKC